MHYDVVFDVNTVGYEAWLFPAGVLIFAVIAVLVVRSVPPRPGVVMTPVLRAVPYLVYGFAVLFTVFSFVGTYVQLARLRAAVASGRVQVVEGQVTDFTPLSDFGNKRESFRVSDHWFAYSDYGVTGGFNNTSTHGGPIREGLPVRVTYVGNTIVRLEVADPKRPSSHTGRSRILLSTFGLLLFAAAGAAYVSIIRRLARYRLVRPTSWQHDSWVQELNPNNYSHEGQVVLGGFRPWIRALFVLEVLGAIIFVKFSFFAHG